MAITTLDYNPLNPFNPLSLLNSCPEFIIRIIRSICDRFHKSLIFRWALPLGLPRILNCPLGALRRFACEELTKSIILRPAEHRHCRRHRRCHRRRCWYHHSCSYHHHWYRLHPLDPYHPCSPHHCLRPSPPCRH